MAVDSELHRLTLEQGGELAQKIASKLDHLPKPEAKRVLDDVMWALQGGDTDLREDLHRLVDSMDAGERALHDLEKEWLAALPDFLMTWHQVVARSARAPIPPNVSTPNNIEAFYMAVGYVFEPLYPLILRLAGTSLTDSRLNESTSAVMLTVRHFLRRDKPPGLVRLFDKYKHVKPMLSEGLAASLQSFSIAWMQSGFAKLEVGHKLAAALALTDIPDDIEVQAPWKSWSLIVPPGLLEATGDPDNTISRIWCEGSEFRFIVTQGGDVLGPWTPDLRDHMPPDVAVTHALMNSLVRGCCLALSNPDEHKRTSKREASGSKRPQRDGLPDFGATRFLLSTPVAVDMRPHLQALRAGGPRAASSPAVQFLVRGHWRHQAHGPGRSLRKQIWIQPFWKGPEESRVLLRNYHIKETP